MVAIERKCFQINATLLGFRVVTLEAMRCLEERLMLCGNGHFVVARMGRNDTATTDGKID
jgi:hypothetical protein